MCSVRFCDSWGVGYNHPPPPSHIPLKEHGIWDTLPLPGRNMGPEIPYRPRKDIGPGNRKGPGTRDTLPSACEQIDRPVNTLVVASGNNKHISIIHKRNLPSFIIKMATKDGGKEFMFLGLPFEQRLDPLVGQE